MLVGKLAGIEIRDKFKEEGHKKITGTALLNDTILSPMQSAGRYSRVNIRIHIEILRGVHTERQRSAQNDN
jgi:hypothetical protein